MTVDKELLARLPRTFVPALNEQLKHWDVLFPAEQRSLRATLEHLGRIPAAEFDGLFAPLKALERKMQLPQWDLSTRRTTIEDISILVRSPFYAEWRGEVERAFERINAAIEPMLLAGRPRNLVLCLLPPGLPINEGSLWSRISSSGRWLALAAPAGNAITGLAGAVAARRPPAGFEPVEATWSVQASRQFADLAGGPALTQLCFDSLAPLRREFLRRLNAIRKDLRSADQTYDDLRRFEVGRSLEPRLKSEPRVREFVRNVFLSGNGALLFANSFVEWGGAEALRRVQPQVLLCFFGIRNKPKPFSSVVLFEDQDRANPTPDQPDPAGSLVDAEILCEYVYRAAERLPAYRGRTLYLFAAAELNKVLLIAPPDVPAPRSLDGVRDWL